MNLDCREIAVRAAEAPFRGGTATLPPLTAPWAPHGPSTNPASRSINCPVCLVASFASHQAARATSRHVTHSIGEEAARFHTGFIASPLREQQPLLLVKDARRWVR